MNKFNLMLRMVEVNGGEYRMGNSWDTIRFFGENHVEVSEKVFNLLLSADVNVYSLMHYPASEATEYSEATPAFSAFEYQ